MKIKIVGLPDCDRCKTFRSKLLALGVEHVFTDCDHDPQNCDNLEALTNSTNYPMALIEDVDDTLLEVYYLTDSYQELIKGGYTQNRIRLIPAHSIDSLLRYTSERLNYKL